MTSRRTYLIVVAIIFSAMAVLSLTACGHGASKPAASEFGFGPRTSAQGTFLATIETDETLKPRKMYTLQLAVRDREGKPLRNAAITVDGGMPQHGHGLPTRPRVT